MTSPTTWSVFFTTPCRGAEIYGKYMEDAGQSRENEFRSFFMEMQEEEKHRAERAKELLMKRFEQEGKIRKTLRESGGVHGGFSPRGLNAMRVIEREDFLRAPELRPLPGAKEPLQNFHGKNAL